MSFSNLNLCSHRCVQSCIPFPLHQPMAQNPPSVPTGYLISPTLIYLFMFIASNGMAKFCFYVFCLLKIIASGSFRSMDTREYNSRQWNHTPHFWKLGILKQETSPWFWCYLVVLLKFLDLVFYATGFRIFGQQFKTKCAHKLSLWYLLNCQVLIVCSYLNLIMKTVKFECSTFIDSRLQINCFIFCYFF